MFSCTMFLTTCRPGDLLVWRNTVVRYESHTDSVVTIQTSPCRCVTCTVGYTTHGTGWTCYVPAEELVFPVYSFLHYWDHDDPLTKLFSRRSGRPVLSCEFNK
jgi:hypothetical protein